MSYYPHIEIFKPLEHKPGFYQLSTQPTHSHAHDISMNTNHHSSYPLVTIDTWRIFCWYVVVCLGFLTTLCKPFRGEAGTRPYRYISQIFWEERKDLSSTELTALEQYRPGETTAARTMAESILQKNPHSYVAHFLMYFVLRNDEGELIRSLWHLRQSITSYKNAYKVSRSRSHHMLLIELISVLRQLGREQESLQLIETHDRLYTGYGVKYEEYRPWVLMKMQRYDEARREALRFLQEKKHITTALNSLCAISFEQNQRQESLLYCEKAYLEDNKRSSTYNRSVHSINLAEAHLSVFDLGKSEQFAFQATRFFYEDLHSTPWEFLLGLYLDQGRYDDAWNAMKKAKSWFYQQSPKLSESVYASNQLAQASFLLTLVRPDIALQVLERIRDRPDRHGHMSAQTRQFVAGARLLRRHALLLQTERMRESAASRGFLFRLFTWPQTLWYRFRAWRQGALLRRQLSEPSFLHNCISPYRSGNLSMPNTSLPHWYTADLIPVMGPAILRKALEHVRALEHKSVSQVQPFLQALEAEISLSRGHYQEAKMYAQAALTQLPRSLVPLQIRMYAVLGTVAQEENRWKNALQFYAFALQKDGSVFRRMQLAIPVKPLTPTTDLGRRLMDSLLRSPRFFQHPNGFTLQVHGNTAIMQVTLQQPNGTVMSRVSMNIEDIEIPEVSPTLRTGQQPPPPALPTTTTPPPSPPKSKPISPERRVTLWLQQLGEKFHKDLFAPAIQLSRQDIFSLDGTPLQNDRAINQLPSFFQQSKP